MNFLDDEGYKGKDKKKDIPANLIEHWRQEVEASIPNTDKPEYKEKPKKEE